MSFCFFNPVFRCKDGNSVHRCVPSQFPANLRGLGRFIVLTFRFRVGDGAGSLYLIQSRCGIPHPLWTGILEHQTSYDPLASVIFAGDRVWSTSSYARS